MNMKHFFSIFVLLFSIFSVSAQTHDSKIAHISNDDVVLMDISYEKLFEFIYAATNKSSDDFSIDYMNIEKAEDEKNDVFYYLIFKGISKTNNEGSYSYALVLDEEDGEIYLLAPGNSSGKVHHSCKGDPCRYCEFKKDEGGVIKGCDCNHGWLEKGYCNHSVSTTQNLNILEYAFDYKIMFDAVVDYNVTHQD